MTTGLRAAFLALICFACAGAYAQITWKRTFGGSAGDRGAAVRYTENGGVLVCGSTGSFGNGGDLYVLSLDAFGVIDWSAVSGGLGVETGWGIVALPDGGSLAVGSTNSFGAGGYDGYVVRFDASGQVLWERTYGSETWDFLYSAQLSGDGFLLAGSTYATADGSSDLWLLRTDLNGDTLWTRTYGSSMDDEGRGVVSLPGNGCVVCGTLRNGGVEADAVLVKYDDAGSEEWSTELGEADEDVGYSVAVVASGGFVIAGYTRSFGPVRQMFMAKVNATGEEQWLRNISSAGDDWEARSIKERLDGTFAVAGYTKEYGAGGKDISMLFVNAQGDFISGPTYGGVEDDEAWSLDFTDDGGYVLAGSTKSYGPGIEAVFVIRSDGDTLNGAVVTTMDPVGIQPLEVQQHVWIHPQPATSGASVIVEGISETLLSAGLIDMRGVMAYQLTVDGSTVQLPELPPGVYVLELNRRSGPVLRERLFIR